MRRTGTLDEKEDKNARGRARNLGILNSTGFSWIPRIL
jgi:hypothetical protein